MRKNRFAALAVIHRAAGQIPADGHANYRGTFKRSIRTPARHAQFIANLHHGRPDIIKKLYLRDWLQSPRCHADGPADDAGLRKRRIENAISAKFALQTGGRFENAALAFDTF